MSSRHRRGSAVEVKNYNVTNPRGISRLVNNVSKQINKRKNDLPPNTRQIIEIDVREQDVSKKTLKDIRKRIREKTNEDIRVNFITK